jgi:RNA polymerase sigma-70 factor, ECF subfamily
LTEIELARRAKEGDQTAFRTLYDTHVDRIFRLTYRMAGDEELARDYTQEAFVRAYQRLDQFRGEARFGTWLHAIAVSVTLNGLRRVKRTRERERPLDNALALSLPPDTALDLKDRLRKAIDGLPDLYRTVFLMHDLEGYSHREIAAALGVAEGTSKARLSRARAKLRDMLGDLVEEYA